MSFARGDVILADLPFSDRTGAKVRPALVVQSDRNNDSAVAESAISCTHHENE
jgi:mRNA-degrading endonuclease toxin of MazEF toxin-antitoxin module